MKSVFGHVDIQRNKRVSLTNRKYIQSFPSLLSVYYSVCRNLYPLCLFPFSAPFSRPFVLPLIPSLNSYYVQVPLSTSVLRHSRTADEYNMASVLWNSYAPARTNGER